MRGLCVPRTECECQPGSERPFLGRSLALALIFSIGYGPSQRDCGLPRNPVCSYEATALHRHAMCHRAMLFDVCLRIRCALVCVFSCDTHVCVQRAGTSDWLSSRSCVCLLQVTFCQIDHWLIRLCAMHLSAQEAAMGDSSDGDEYAVPSVSDRRMKISAIPRIDFVRFHDWMPRFSAFMRNAGKEAALAVSVIEKHPQGHARAGRYVFSSPGKWNAERERQKAEARLRAQAVATAAAAAASASNATEASSSGNGNQDAIEIASVVIDAEVARVYRRYAEASQTYNAANLLLAQCIRFAVKTKDTGKLGDLKRSNDGRAMWEAMSGAVYQNAPQNAVTLCLNLINVRQAESSLSKYHDVIFDWHQRLVSFGEEYRFPDLVLVR